MTIENSSQREIGTRDTGTDGREATGTDTEVQGDVDRPETRVEGPKISHEVRTGSIDLVDIHDRILI